MIFLPIRWIPWLLAIGGIGFGLQAAGLSEGTAALLACGLVAAAIIGRFIYIDWRGRRYMRQIELLHQFGFLPELDEREVA